MDIYKAILNAIKKQGEISASDIVKKIGFSRAYINRFFQKLRDEGKIVLIGKANRARYIIAERNIVASKRRKILDTTRILRNKDLSEDLVLADFKKNTGIFVNIRKNVSNILDYAFSEMLNNAIEHSESKIIRVNMQRDKNAISFGVVDEGIGIFNNIIRKKRLSNELDAVQDLLKGKQTTSPEMHSGEGIFFTSKAADFLIIQGSHKKLVFDNILSDIFIRDIKNISGTKVGFSISLSAKRTLNEIFKQYTDSSFEFSKTKVTVRMYKTKTDYVSRSQARRIVSGLEKFKTIILDFADMKTIGQGFADEIFRVWQLNNPKITIKAINADENVRFMIARAKSG